MDNFMSNLLVPLFFVHATVGIGIAAWWFHNRKDKNLRIFGLGLAGYSAGFAAWAAAVIIQPENLKPLILLGAIPFLLAHFLYAKVAYKNINFAKTSLLTLLVAGTITATFVVRTFLYPSDAYFSEEGLLYFGLHPVAVAFYIATLTLTFLPAINVVGELLKKSAVRIKLQAALTTLFINGLIIVSSENELLLTINGYVFGAALIVLWFTALTNQKAKV